MAREYFKVFGSYLASIEPLSNEARGRLFTALLTYHITGEEPVLHGSEKYIFPTMKQNMDRDNKAYENVVNACHINGKKGGRPRKNEVTSEKANENEKTETVISKPNKRQDKDKDKDKDDLSLKEIIKRKTAERFFPPTLDEIKDYCLENSLRVDPEYFFDYYSSNGWMVGKVPMQDFTAALRWWEKNGFAYPRGKGEKSRAEPFPSSFDTDDFFEAAVARSMRMGKASCDIGNPDN